MAWVMDGLETESYDRTYPDRVLVRRMMSYFKPHAGKLAAVAAALFLNSAAGAAGPILVAEVIDYVARTPSLGVFAAAGIAVSAVTSLSWLFTYVHQRLVTQVIGDVVLSVRENAFRRTMEHDLSFFDENPSGKIVSRIASDTQDFSTTVTLVADLLSEGLTVLLLTIWLFAINARLTVILLVMTPFAVLIALGFRAMARRVTQDAKRVTADINARIQESVSGIVIAKTFRRERALFDSFRDGNKLAYRVGIRRGIVLNTILPLIGVSSGAASAVLAWTGGSAVQAGTLSPGDWYLFIQAVGFFWWPMLNIASFWSQFQDGLSASERVFALIDAEPRVKQAAHLPFMENCPSCPVGIEFRDVTFSYTGGEPVLERFNLSIEPGESIAIVGHTGAGKSSIARLAARFYEYQSGQILVDGKDIRSLDLASYRRRIGYVPQDPFLFTGTVAENIRYGRPEASDEEVRQAAHHLGRGDWLEDLANGIATEAGERGAGISFGQRQLVALARVLLKDPALFILDEATASVDPFTEAQIQEGFQSVMKGRTSILIAHRLFTVRHADRIIVLDRGKIVEEGNHDSLLAAGGSYAELYDTYFRHQSLEYIERQGGELP